MSNNLKLQVEIDIIGSYKRLSYTAWHALGEFVDNSTQAYFNNKSQLDEVFKAEGKRLTVDLFYDRDGDKITVKDNSIGMKRTELEAALHIGVRADGVNQRSKYGLGLKTAACWFGNTWTLRTKKLGETKGVSIVVDVEKVLSTKSTDLPTEEFDDEPGAHYTHLTITQLHKQFHTRTLSKVKDFLRSMYRLDFVDPGLILKWQNEEMSWPGFDNRLYVTQDGKPFKQPLEFSIGTPSKAITGWVGVLAKGTRKDAGFSIIQNNRVVRGWPDGYRPYSLYGDQEGGSNDLTNQRLVGELYVDSRFAVSHTKDAILWEDAEEEELEKKLEEECANAKVLAQNLRFKGNADQKLTNIKADAFDVFESELKSDQIKDKLFNETLPDDKAIAASYQKIVAATVKSSEPDIDVVIGDEPSGEFVKVMIFLRSTSEFEPYVVIQTTPEKNTVIVIINALHPYWAELKNIDGFLSYIRHCVYDGVSEWRVSKKTGLVSANAIKYVKDNLLRLPFEIVSSKYSPPDEGE